MNLLDIVSVNSVWISVGDLDEVRVISVDYGTDYPVQFRWNDGLVGRDTIEGFIDAFIPARGWAALLVDLDC